MKEIAKPIIDLIKLHNLDGIQLPKNDEEILASLSKFINAKA